MDNVSVFTFNAENLVKANIIIQRYPLQKQQSAVLPLLDLAQRQSGGWLPRAAIEYVANFLEMPLIRVYEVATFYTMFNLNPIGKYHIQVCGTTPCWLKGADEIMQSCKRVLRIECGEKTSDGLFSLSEVECLGACVDAPVVQINDDYFEHLTSSKIADLLLKIKKT
jgi:NADH-quinone oxidoreductase subunit E